MEKTRTGPEKEAQQRLDIPVNINKASVLRNFKQERIREKAEKTVDELLAWFGHLIRPKALYRISCIGERERDRVEIDGVKFTSRVLSKSLSDTDTVIPYIVTSGRELDGLPVSPKDYFRYYCLDMLKVAVLFEAGKYFIDYLKQKYSLPDATHLHPGEFADWPIEQQTPLFSLFDDTETAIGVKLTSTRTIQPVKSGSGILFSSGTSFESCQLCVQARCPGRRAAYSRELARRLLDSPVEEKNTGQKGSPGQKGIFQR